MTENSRKGIEVQVVQPKQREAKASPVEKRPDWMHAHELSGILDGVIEELRAMGQDDIAERIANQVAQAARNHYGKDKPPSNWISELAAANRGE